MSRITDIVLTLLLLIVLSPLILLIAVSVYLFLGRPILFNQTRAGRQGHSFLLYKFRSMLPQHDKAGHARSEAERLTRFGSFIRKYSLDELPQLWNVLRGDLSLIGPRPLLVRYLPLYNAEQAKRHNIRPGITGWAQVNGRNALRWDETFKLDVWYVEHRCWQLNLKILWLTVLNIIKPHGFDLRDDLTEEILTSNQQDG